jgi:hypothetical protein
VTVDQSAVCMEQVTIEALRPVVELKKAAVEAEDYARAAHLQQIIKVLHPDNKMTPVRREAHMLRVHSIVTHMRADPHTIAWFVFGGGHAALQDLCKPQTPEAQIEFFHEHGFVILTGILEGERLERAQRVWNSVMEPQYAAWEAERAKGRGFSRTAGGGFAEGTTVARRYFDLKGLMDADEELWIDMMDSPTFRPVISRFAGGGDEEGEPGGGNEVYHGIARVGGVGGRVIPPDTDPRYSEQPMGYLAW